MGSKNQHPYVYAHPLGEGHGQTIKTTKFGSISLLHGQLVFFKQTSFWKRSTTWHGTTFDPVRAQWILKGVPWARGDGKADRPPKWGDSSDLYCPGNPTFEGTFIAIDVYSYEAHGSEFKHKDSVGSIYDLRQHYSTTPNKLYRYDAEQEAMIEDVTLPENSKIIIGYGYDYVFAKTETELTTWPGQYQRVWGYIKRTGPPEEEGDPYPTEVVETNGLYLKNKVSCAKTVNIPDLDHYVINTY